MKRLEIVLPRPLARAERLAMAVDPYPGRRILIGAAPERIRRLADIGRKCLAHVIDEPDEFILGVICMKLFCDGFRIVTIAAHAFRRAEDDLAWLDGMQQRFDAENHAAEFCFSAAIGDIERIFPVHARFPSSKSFFARL